MDTTFDFILRITVAAILGGAIGLEREYREKAAGFRTHFLVALGSALFMIISVYGFDGGLTSANHRLDVSRVAAQVVSGIGFIGAGSIVFQKNMVVGLPQPPACGLPLPSDLPAAPACICCRRQPLFSCL